jgi:hypothetical protein
MKKILKKLKKNDLMKYFFILYIDFINYLF